MSYSQIHSHAFSRALPQLLVIPSSFEFWLVHCIVRVICDWLEWLLWYWFYNTQLKIYLCYIKTPKPYKQLRLCSHLLPEHDAWVRFSLGSNWCENTVFERTQPWAGTRNGTWSTQRLNATLFCVQCSGTKFERSLVIRHLKQWQLRRQGKKIFHRRMSWSFQ